MHLHITWASQTSHSFDLARSFLDLCQQSDLPITSASPLSSESFTQGIWIIFISTTGQGAHPYSMRTLWKDMMKKQYKLPQSMKFAVYSLGDRGYGQNFGLAGRKLRQRLRMLGAEELLQIGLGDDQDPQGYRQVYQSGWSQSLIKILKQLLPPQKTIPPCLTMRNYKQQLDFQIQNIQQLTNRKGRKIVWLQGKIHEGKVQQGDVLQIYPHNRKEDVQYLLTSLKKTGQEIYTYLNMPLPLRTILTEHINISSTLNYYFLSNQNHQILSNSCHNPLHRQKLEQFHKDYEQFYHYIVQYKRNLVQFLKDFEIQLNIQYLLQHIGPIIPRKYSIARTNNNIVWLLIKIVQVQLTPGRHYQGLCSHDLLKPCSRKVTIQKSQITPQKLKQNNLIITLGTGIAPFLWIIDQLDNKHQQALLIYTNSHQDELFHHQLCKKTNNLQQIISCTREGGPKLLKLLQINIDKITCFLSSPSRRIFYCGPKQIQQYLQTIISQLLNVSKQTLRKQNLIIYQNW